MYLQQQMALQQQQVQMQLEQIRKTPSLTVNVPPMQTNQ